MKLLITGGAWFINSNLEITQASGLDDSLLHARPTSELKVVATRPPRAGPSDATLRGMLGHRLTPMDVFLREMAGETS